jgi:transcriptional regulator with XRE-family HTH domain
MNTRPTHFLSEIKIGDTPIPVGQMEYLRARTRNRLYGYIIRKLIEARKETGLTNAELARRIGYDQGRLSRLLAAPGNWTISTVSDLLVGIAAEELKPASATLLHWPERNDQGQSFAESETSLSTKAEFKFSDPSRTTQTQNFDASAR